METYIPNSAFTCIVPYKTWSWSCSTHTRYVDDYTTFTSLNRLVNPSITSQIHALDVDIENPVEFFFGNRRCRLVCVRPARIVYEDVATPKFLNAGCYTCFPVG